MWLFKTEDMEIQDKAIIEKILIFTRMQANLKMCFTLVLRPI